MVRGGEEEGGRVREKDKAMSRIIVISLGCNLHPHSSQTTDINKYVINYNH